VKPQNMNLKGLAGDGENRARRSRSKRPRPCHGAAAQKSFKDIYPESFTRAEGEPPREQAGARLSPSFKSF
ncbi:MAG: hypothetical protein IJU71_02275, partial [Selenomonadaceae bacterium]|nr:hypothetical protein [Selenomonadaceae bacterium]